MFGGLPWCLVHSPPAQNVCDLSIRSGSALQLFYLPQADYVITIRMCLLNVACAQDAQQRTPVQPQAVRDPSFCILTCKATVCHQPCAALRTAGESDARRVRRFGTPISIQLIRACALLLLTQKHPDVPTLRLSQHEAASGT